MEFLVAIGTIGLFLIVITGMSYLFFVVYNEGIKAGQKNCSCVDTKEKYNPLDTIPDEYKQDYLKLMGTNEHD